MRLLRDRACGRVLLVALLATPILIVAPGCGSDDKPNANNSAGSTASGGKGGKGAQTTLDAGTSGGTTAKGSGGSAGSDTPASNLAKTCSKDGDCGAGLKCLTASGTDFLGGGPPNGYCSASCQTSDDCTAFGGVCVDMRIGETDPPELWCMQECQFGVQGNNKCQTRPDVGCNLVNQNGTAACVPVCSQDSDCPTGRKCDPRKNVCTETPTPGDIIGTHCSQSEDKCGGLCIRMGTTSEPLTFVCSRRCVLGRPDGCNATSDALSSTAEHGQCAYVPTRNGTSAVVGDVGHCAQQCDKAEDCLDQASGTAFCDQRLAPSTGHGHCFWNESGSAGAGGASGQAGQAGQGGRAGQAGSG